MTELGILFDRAAGYLIVLNVLGLALMGYDKRNARLHRRRVSENTLLTVAAMGGSAGAILGMLLFRHKTRHVKFTLGLPAILLAQLGLVFYLVRQISASGA